VNPRNGKILWEGPSYADYGTPAVMKVGKRIIVITSSGRALDAKSGRVLAKGLGEVWFSSPVVKGDRLYFAGSIGPEIETSNNEIEEHKITPTGEAIAKIRAVQVRGVRGGKLDWRILWETPLLQDNYFSSPATDGTTLYAVSHHGHLTAVNVKSGAILYHKSLRKHGYDDVYASPIISNERIIVLESHGAITSVKKGNTFVKLSFNQLNGRYIACGFLRDGQLALRSDERIIFIGSR
jgi:outer membrane protein assembly factor BamB